MTDQQQKALAFFNDNKYLVVDAPRRSGKTTLLKEIIRKNSDKRIGIICLNYPTFRNLYKEFKNCEYIERLEYPLKKRFDILLGDEILIEPNETPSACVFTKRYVIKKWRIENPFIDKKQLDELRKEITPKKYEIEFGQYE